MIRLSITTGQMRRGFKVFEPWWDNLFDAGTETKLFKWKNVDKFLLKNYRARVVYDEQGLDESIDGWDEPAIIAIEFDNEADASLFLLRWA